LRFDFQRTADLKAAQLQRLEFDLQRLLNRQEVDLGRVETAIRQVEAIRTELRLGRIKTLEMAKATLTPEQRLKLQPVLRGGP
jgi:Spy/CpxP family protein refolding chaperone